MSVCYHWDCKFFLWSLFAFINTWYVSRVRAHVYSHCITVARKHLFGCQGGKVLFNIIVKPIMFWLGIVPKETVSRILNLVHLKMF